MVCTVDVVVFEGVVVELYSAEKFNRFVLTIAGAPIQVALLPIARDRAATDRMIQLTSLVLFQVATTEQLLPCP
jgi:hypothetical protein